MRGRCAANPAVAEGGEREYDRRDNSLGHAYSILPYEFSVALTYSPGFVWAGSQICLHNIPYHTQGTGTKKAISIFTGQNFVCVTRRRSSIGSFC